MRQMQEGKLDAVFTDSVFAYYYIYSGGDPFYVLSDSLGEDEYAIGFRKHDQALRDRVQQILNEMSTDGTLSELSKKWFGSDITLVR
jgi:ABC-type amino acid transport substrate-binding protein